MFKNLVTLVTGGASGLGKATVTRFVNKGSKVVFCDLPTSNGANVAKELGENAHYIPADVTSEEDVQRVLSEISKNYGKLNVLVNCAGLMNAYITYNFHSKKPRHHEDFIKILKTNVVGTFNVSRLACGLIGKNTPDNDGLRGVIINTAGIEAFDGVQGQIATAAASGAIHSLTKPMAADFKDIGIRVVAIAPGIIETPLNDQIPSEQVEAIVKECIPTPNRFGHPDEFAQLVQTIVANPYINATTIELSAGLNLQF
ncbi:3-hydroxyacyl-CoA dehydrogenase type-2-like [Contarinia nasturtii]|uniref:3-hydroxyacyl-CoA dehydrogenase type-2-like n=1 Tax=Contarinia nasturtii TaxID=265458 RepID=UPI0012D45DCE|nr:3-hydroxyacyl-CoA dehydrogenase type-2-like [Contarinia nasturtii]